MPRRLLEARATISVISALAAVILSAGLTAAVGVAPFDAYREMLRGSVGDLTALGNTVVKALPLAFVALGFTVTYRAGLWNIGLEGQLYVGAVFATVAATQIEPPSVIQLPLAVVAGACGGALWAAIPALLKAWRDVNEIVSSLFLSYIAVLLTSWLLLGPIKDPVAIYPQSSTVPDGARFPTLVAGTGIHAGILLAAGAGLLVYLLLNRSILGYEMRTAGANPRVARYAGIGVRRLTLYAFLFSGGLAGLAGTVEVLGNQHLLIENFSPGWGFTGIAAALLGGATALGSLVAAAFFGALSAGADQLQFRLEVPATFAIVVQAIAVILVLSAPYVISRFRIPSLRRNVAARILRRSEGGP